MFTLRDYQTRCLDSINEGYKENNLNQLVISSTGTGKNLIVCSIKKHLGLKGTVLILAHLDFLLHQAKKTWQEVNPEDKIGLEQAENHIDEDEEYDVIFASLQTLRGKRLESLLQRAFCFVGYDEVQHVTSESYLKVIDLLGLLPNRRTSSALFVGVTASPNRTDKKDLKEVLPYVAFEYDHWQALEAGWWCPVHAKRVYTGANLEKVSVVAGKYVESELDFELVSTSRTKILWKAWKESEPDLGHTVIFCSSRVLARHVQENWPCKKMFYLDGDTENRMDIVQEFRETPGSVLVNVRLLVEGVDVPDISHIVYMSPIHSDIFHVQSLGRGTRPSINKDKLVVLYSVDKTGAKIKLKSPASLLGLPSSFDLEGVSLLECRARLQQLTADVPMGLRALVESGRIPDCFSELEKSLKSLALYCPTDLQGPLKGHTNLAWCITDIEALLSGELDSAESFLLSTPAPLSPVPGEPVEARQIHIEWDMNEWCVQFLKPNAQKVLIQKQIRRLSVQAKEEQNRWKSFQQYKTLKELRKKEALLPYVLVQKRALGKDLLLAVKQIDKAIKEKMPSALKIISLDAAWRKGEPTEAQLKLAKKVGIPIPDNISKGELSLLIDHRIRQEK